MSATSSTTASSVTLNRYKQRTVDIAREALAREHGTDAGSLACRVGVLEWHFGELLALIGKLAADG